MFDVFRAHARELGGHDNFANHDRGIFLAWKVQEQGGSRDNHNEDKYQRQACGIEAETSYTVHRISFDWSFCDTGGVQELDLLTVAQEGYSGHDQDVTRCNALGDDHMVSLDTPGLHCGLAHI